MLNPNVLRAALTRFEEYNSKRPGTPDKAIIVDFSLPSDESRLFIVNREDGEILDSFRVAHGSGSGERFPRYFSNEEGSHMSSLGLARLAEHYIGKYGMSIRLDGLDSTNSNLRTRAVVIHRSNYVPRKGVVGRSWGCFAVNVGDIQKLLALPRGTLLFAGK